MNKLIYIIIAFIGIAVSFASCSLDENGKEGQSVSEWRKNNDEWLKEQTALKGDNGMPFYQEVSPVWYPEAKILMHWFNDREATAGNLVPMETSTVAVKYMLRNYLGEKLDSSYNQPDSIFQTKVTGVISGWQIALQQMHVGDSVRIVVPYDQGYGTSATASIRAYSNLEFDIKLVDIPYYEIRPEK